MEKPTLPLQKVAMNIQNLLIMQQFTRNDMAHEDSVTARPELFFINRVLSQLPPVFILDYQISG